MPSVTPSLVTHAFARVRPVGALWRLRGYLKPYRTQMIVMFAAALGAVADIEKSIRDGLYAYLQGLQASFHDEWQSGQLLSRATTDLSAIRRFAGFGLIFLTCRLPQVLARGSGQ